jgi:CRISPR-associated endonuclease/helicase Cas3
MLPTELGEPRLWHRLFWACVFHDVGKTAPGFQDRLRGQKNTPEAKQWGRHRHEILSLAFVSWAFPAASKLSKADVAAVDGRWIAAAVASHHKDAAEIELLYPVEADDDLAGVLATLPEATVAGIHRWLTDCVPRWATSLGLPGIEQPIWPPLPEATIQVRLEGARRVRRFLRSYGRWVQELTEQSEPCPAELLLRGLLLQADHTASAHTRALRPVSIAAANLRRTWNLVRTYTHQDMCGSTTGSVILTAPTGSGKTEAAILWAARQAEAGRILPRLFYALPYQASMNAMYRRLAGNLSARQVGLQHGRALLALHRFAMEADPDPASAARQARWRRKLAYLNYFPVRVFSPYQMLKVVFNLKGFEAMLLDYQGAAFIFDEIHAYEPERLGLILGLVEHLQQHYRARFLVMSATLPALVAHALAGAIGPVTTIRATEGLYEEFRRHRIKVIDGDLLEQLHLVEERAHQGSSVLVCCNTVQRAQDAWKELRARLPSHEVVLLHGRFNGRDRLSRESTVREATGARSANRRPIVLVATQVVEVSLDIDLDTIFTDPAPLEALLQRFGRINRQRLQSGLATVQIFTQPDDGQNIYDARLVQASLAVLRATDGQPLDEAHVSSWLDNVYSGDVKTEWDTKYRKSLTECRQILRGLRPFQSDESLNAAFDAAFDSVEVLPANLLPEYDRLRADDPIRATALLVSISDRRRAQLRHSGRLRADTYPPVADVPYSTEVGLDFSAIQGSGE